MASTWTLNNAVHPLKVNKERASQWKNKDVSLALDYQ